MSFFFQVDIHLRYVSCASHARRAPRLPYAQVSSSVESFYRGAVAGGVFGLVFGPETGVGVVAHLMAPFRPALLAGSWCLLTSFSSCALSRDGLPFPWNGALSGLFSVMAKAATWCPVRCRSRSNRRAPIQTTRFEEIYVVSVPQEAVAMEKVFAVLVHSMGYM
eukprot:g18419.t1